MAINTVDSGMNRTKNGFTTFLDNFIPTLPSFDDIRQPALHSPCPASRPMPRTGHDTYFSPIEYLEPVHNTFRKKSPFQRPDSPVRGGKDPNGEAAGAGCQP
ncbi:hypothetical protein K9F62_00150 [Desulfovibrio sp. JY]|nr:hypothetical protein K9F62_00150 [Desulfovibrio sp. JY]